MGSSVFVPLLVAAWTLGLQVADLSSPEAALRTFVDATNRRDSVGVYEAYALELTHQRWHFSGPGVQSYVIKKRSVLDSAAVHHWNGEGIIPPARIGDVELDVEVRIDGRPMMVTYNLRSFGGRWRIYAHAAWDVP